LEKLDHRSTKIISMSINYGVQFFKVKILQSQDFNTVVRQLHSKKPQLSVFIHCNDRNLWKYHGRYQARYLL